jgi:hypothetical protein
MRIIVFIVAFAMLLASQGLLALSFNVPGFQGFLFVAGVVLFAGAIAVAFGRPVSNKPAANDN